MTDERIDRATRLAAVILGVFVVGLFLVASVLLLAGCSAPCTGHGGVDYVLGGWYHCHDGTIE
jgi:hypothetical protein